MSGQLLELVTLTFKDSPPSPPPAFTKACNTLRTIPGVLAIHLGQQLEHPGHRYTWAILWASPSALAAFRSSPESPPLAASLASSVTSLGVLQTVLSSPGDIAAALGAPCTEIFLSFGADDEYLERRMRPFAASLTAGGLSGFHALAYGEAPEEGKTVVLIIGWDSKEAHLAERGEGKLIDNNIHYVREGRKSVDMYHVKFASM